MGDFLSIQDIYHDKKLFPVIVAGDGNHAGMVLRLSCIRREVSHDQFGVMGILRNNGRGCGSREKVLVANG